MTNNFIALSTYCTLITLKNNYLTDLTTLHSNIRIFTKMLISLNILILLCTSHPSINEWARPSWLRMNSIFLLLDGRGSSYNRKMCWVWFSPHKPAKPDKLRSLRVIFRFFSRNSFLLLLLVYGMFFLGEFLFQ